MTGNPLQGAWRRHQLVPCSWTSPDSLVASEARAAREVLRGMGRAA